MALHLVTDTPTAMRAIVGVTLRQVQARYVPLARPAGPLAPGTGSADARCRQRRRAAALRTSDSTASFDEAPGRAGKKRGGCDEAERRRSSALVRPLESRRSREVAKTGHDLKNMAIVLARQGIKLRGLDTDTMLVSYVLDATRSDHASKISRSKSSPTG